MKASKRGMVGAGGVVAAGGIVAGAVGVWTTTHATSSSAAGLTTAWKPIEGEFDCYSGARRKYGIRIDDSLPQQITFGGEVRLTHDCWEGVAEFRVKIKYQTSSAFGYTGDSGTFRASTPDSGAWVVRIPTSASIRAVCFAVGPEGALPSPKAVSVDKYDPIDGCAKSVMGDFSNPTAGP